VILAEDVAHYGRALLVRTTRHEAEIVHGVEHAPVYRLESVADIGERARHDDAHRVVDERLLDLVVDQARKDAFAVVRCGHFWGAIDFQPWGVADRETAPVRRSQRETFLDFQIYPKTVRKAMQTSYVNPLQYNYLRGSHF
jgi:hypothetical protein